jgi:hypothetical protein
LLLLAYRRSWIKQLPVLRGIRFAEQTLLPRARQPRLSQKAHFDALAPIIQEMFAEPVKSNETRTTTARCESSGCGPRWPIEDMVDLARVFKQGFGYLYTRTNDVFAEILIELRQEAEGDYPGL